MRKWAWEMYRRPTRSNQRHTPIVAAASVLKFVRRHGIELVEDLRFVIVSGGLRRL